jgi:DNA-binding response OmpR family regulator
MAPSTADLSSAFQGKTVLVVDDDRIIREYISLRCSQAGLNVKLGEDGWQALLQVSKHDPDVLILDLHLPDVEGFHVCLQLKDPKFRPLPVIMLTASSDEKTKRRCEQLGAVYVQKGAQLWDDLSVAMHRIFETSRASHKKNSGATDRTQAPNVPLVDDDTQSGG